MKILKHISKGFLIILSLEIVGCLYLIIQANLKESGNDGTIGIWNLGWSFFLITKLIFFFINWRISKMRKFRKSCFWMDLAKKIKFLQFLFFQSVVGRV